MSGVAMRGKDRRVHTRVGRGGGMGDGGMACLREDLLLDLLLDPLLPEVVGAGVSSASESLMLMEPEPLLDLLELLLLDPLLDDCSSPLLLDLLSSFLLLREGVVEGVTGRGEQL